MVSSPMARQSEFGLIVLVNFWRYVGKILHGILHRTMQYFEENAAKLWNFEVTNFPSFWNIEEMNFRFFEFSKQRTVVKNTLFIIIAVTYITRN